MGRIGMKAEVFACRAEDCVLRAEPRGGSAEYCALRAEPRGGSAEDCCSTAEAWPDPVGRWTFSRVALKIVLSVLNLAVAPLKVASLPLKPSRIGSKVECFACREVNGALPARPGGT